MPFESFERTAPSSFKQEASVWSRMILLCALAIFLMVADLRFAITKPFRATLATIIYPAQWLALKPLQWLQSSGQQFDDLKSAQNKELAASKKLAEQSLQISQTQYLANENMRLRKLLSLRDEVAASGQPAEVLYDAPDPFGRKVVIDRGSMQNVEAGSPVIDELGVIGQVTRVYPMMSEVTLITDREQTIPILNLRTNARSVSYGHPAISHIGQNSSADLIELRFTSGNDDVQIGDALTTSGVDGIYPAGLPVARVERIDRKGDSSFAQVFCRPLGKLQGARYVMVVKPGTPRIKPDTTPPSNASKSKKEKAAAAAAKMKGGLPP